MSSWKKAAKAGQRIHRERHQPEARSNLGLLEKKQDYKRRANDTNRKNNTIKYLRKKALNKNPDEFYFHMINSKLDHGVHHEIEKGDEHTPEQKQLMRTQDLRYITMKRTIEAKKVQSLKAELHMLDEANNTANTHLFFVDSEKEARKLNVADRLDTHPSLLANRVNRLRKMDLETQVIDTLGQDRIKLAEQHKKKKYAQLAKRIEREKELGIVQKKLEMKRHLTAPGASSPILEAPATKTSAPVYKFKFERKR